MTVDVVDRADAPRLSADRVDGPALHCFGDPAHVRNNVMRVVADIARLAATRAGA